MAYSYAMKNVRFMLPIAITVLTVIGIGVLVKSLSAPSHGHTTNTGGKVAAQHSAPSIKVAPSSVSENAYYVLQLPVGYVSQTSSQTTPGLLYQQTIIKSAANGSQVISVALQNLPLEGITDLSAYRLRSSQLGRYVFSSPGASSPTLQIARDTQSASVVAFWTHGGIVATIGVTTGLSGAADTDNTDELRALQPLLNGWQWR